MVNFNSLRDTKVIKQIFFDVDVVEVIEHSAGYVVVLYNKYSLCVYMYAEYKYKKSALKYAGKIYYEYNSN